MGAKVAALAFGLWLAGAPAIVTQACLPSTASAKTECDGCCGQSGGGASCCITVKAQKDCDATVTQHDCAQELVPEGFVTLSLGAASRPEATEEAVLAAAVRAEGPPLYLRYEVLLI